VSDSVTRHFAQIRRVTLSLTRPTWLAEQEEVLSRILLDHIYAGGTEVSLKELLLKRQEVEIGVVEALSSSLGALTR
ncbi:MAG: hypothetical protein ACXWT1_22690, partial [Methylobacter sp.]